MTSTSDQDTSGRDTSGKGKIIAIEFVTLDGVVEDPDGRAGTPFGGWAFRFGAAAIGGDKFRLDSIMQTGALLFGRGTWEHFAGLWPARSDPFSAAMNALPKYVVSRGVPDLAAWPNSRPLDGDLVGAVTGLAQRQDVVVIGSISVVGKLADAGIVDEYRLLVVPSFVGSGRRMFDTRVDLDLVAAVTDGPMTLLTLTPHRS